MKKIDRSTLYCVRVAIPLCLSFLILSAVVLTAVFLPSLGWFTNNRSVVTTGLHVVTSCEDCDLIVVRPTEYDKTKGSPPIERYPGIGLLKEYFEDDGFDVDVETSTAAALKLAFEMVNELERTDFDEYAEGQVATRFLMPGAYGTLTFYLRPFDGVDRLQKTFTLSLDGFRIVKTNEGDEIRRVTSQGTLDLLRGHILFFTERSGADREHYEYDGLVEESFTFDTDGRSPIADGVLAGCYEVTLYWEWPETYIDISRRTSDNGNTRKYPAELGDYVSRNPQYFFAINQASEDEKERSEGYDDGDQKIGNQVHFVSASLTVN